MQVQCFHSGLCRLSPILSHQSSTVLFPGSPPPPRESLWNSLTEAIQPVPLRCVISNAFLKKYFETRSSYVVQAGLEPVAILLPQSSACWGYRCVPCLVRANTSTELTVGQALSWVYPMSQLSHGTSHVPHTVRCGNQGTDFSASSKVTGL